jgi:hypothetical protein
MTTLTIEIPEKGKKKLTALIEELGGKIVTIETVAKNHTGNKKKVLDDLDESVLFVKQHQQGKVKAKTIEQLLNEL